MAMAASSMPERHLSIAHFSAFCDEVSRHYLCMIDIRARIKERRQKHGLTQVALAELAGLHPSAVSRFENGERNLKPDQLSAVAGALAISLEKLYATDANVVDAVPDIRQIPVIDYVQAGRWTAVNPDLSEVRETIPTNLECPPSTFAMRIRGDSMQPLFNEGDIVTINPMLSPLPGDYVVAVEVSGEATFKKFRIVGLNADGRSVFELVALNPDYGSVRSDVQEIAIVGTMIEHRTFRRR